MGRGPGARGSSLGTGGGGCGVWGVCGDRGRREEGLRVRGVVHAALEGLA